MAGSKNLVILIGNIGKDPEVRQTNDGKTITSLTIATNDRYKDRTGNWVDKTEWSKVVAFEPKSVPMGKYLRKGSSVYIEGKLQTRSWDDNGQKRYVTEIVVRDFEFLDKKSGDDPYVQEASVPFNGGHPSGIESDDLPF